MPIGEGMADYIYTSEGRPQGFRRGDHIYAMDGIPLGRVWAEKAYSLAGDYVGAVINNMVVDRPGVSTRAIKPVSRPDNAVPPHGAEARRPIGEPLADCFHLLLEVAGRSDSELQGESLAGVDLFAR
jgi:hypothetical protein